MADKDFVVRNGIVVNSSLIYATGGQVGINTTSLNSTLTVSGTANVSGNVALANNLIVAGNSTLAAASDVVLDVSVTQEACPHNLAPTSSTTSMLALGDALAMVLLEERGFTREDFARFHPAGRLGRTLLLRVRDIMRGADEAAIVRGSDLVVDVLRVLTAKRAGAAVVADKDGTLRGIFTHGDFAHRYPSDPGIGMRRVEEVMTTDPVTIDADKLAVEVLMVLEQNRIDDLVVTEAGGKPLGVVDSQDLSRLKLI